MRKHVIGISIAFVVFITGISLDYFWRIYTQPILDIHEPIAKQQSKLIPDELIGKYFFGDALGFNFMISISDTGETEFIWQGCMGTYIDVKGIATYVNGTLLLSFQ